MKKAAIQAMIGRKERIERGEATPAAVWNVKPDGKSGFVHRKTDPQEFQREQKKRWDRTVAGTRQKLGLSQSGFAELLGISIRTLHHWEQGTRRPSGAARILLRVAEKHPDIVLEAAA